MIIMIFFTTVVLSTPAKACSACENHYPWIHHPPAEEELKDYLQSYVIRKPLNSENITPTDWNDLASENRSRAITEIIKSDLIALLLVLAALTTLRFWPKFKQG